MDLAPCWRHDGDHAGAHDGDHGAMKKDHIMSHILIACDVNPFMHLIYC